jgi:hypothetical protein
MTTTTHSHKAWTDQGGHVSPIDLPENGGPETRAGAVFTGGKQLGFTDNEQGNAKKCAQRERVLSEIAAVVPCQALIDLIEPRNPKTG